MRGRGLVAAREVHGTARGRGAGAGRAGRTTWPGRAPSRATVATCVDPLTTLHGAELAPWRRRMASDVGTAI